MTRPPRDRTTPAAPRRVPLPKLVAGILLHFAVPAYLLACLAAALLVEPAVTQAKDILPRMLWTAAWFIPAFLSLTAFGAAVAALVERGTVAPGADPVAIARAQLDDAHRTLRALGDGRVDRALARLEANGWDLAEPGDAQVAADLDAAARTFAVAAASAAPERRPEVLALAGDSVERLAAAAAALAAARSRLDEGDARTVAGYLEARYRDG